MTFLYPAIDSPELQPYAAPFGRLMLGYGRAVTAAIALAKRSKLRTEIKAAQLVNNNSKRLPDDMRALFRRKFKKEDFEALGRALDRMKEIAHDRNQLVHGEWWFNAFEGEQLQTRNVKNNRIIHGKSFSPDLLNQYATDLDAIADEFDRLENVLRQRRVRVLKKAQ